MAEFVRMLGPPTMHHGGTDIEPAPCKTSSLLYTLAYRRGWVPREDLLALLYPESPERRAQQNLRSLLQTLRNRGTWADVEIEPRRLRWRVATDVAAFHEALAEQRLSLAIELYRGPLLQGFTPTPSEAFEDWLQQERRALENLWHDAVLQQARVLEQQGEHRRAADLLARLQQSDPFDEAALRSRLRALAHAGDRGAALDAFQTFAARLDRELGVGPEASTLRLAEGLRAGNLQANAGTPQPATRSPRPARHRRRPPPPRPFFGREAELALAQRYLRDPDCRLLTLVGPGGIGKTALALELASRLDPDDLGHVTFVPLETATNADEAVTAIADALGQTLFGPIAPRRQLLDALAAGTYLTSDHLLLLDNLEHLTDAGALLADILDVGADLRLLTTSRRRLGLRQEWHLDVNGLLVDGLPVDGLPLDGLPVDEAVAPAAIELFAAAAKRSDATFDPDRQRDAVTAICRLVGGMPLALELAAAWTSTLSAEDIAASLANDLTLLRSEAADRPPRHASVEAVLDTTWRHLETPDREALAGLATFTGSFTTEAARQVAGADPATLRRLVEHALLRKGYDGRLSQHPLLARITRERARAQPARWDAARARHAEHFTAHLERITETAGIVLGSAAEEHVADLPNVLSAWDWATDAGRTDLLVRAVRGVLLLARTAQRPRVAAKAIARAIAVTPPDGAAMARLLRALGHLQHWSFDMKAAVASMHHSVAILESLDDRAELGLSLASLALVAVFEPEGAVDVRATLVRAVALLHESGNAVDEGSAMVNLAEHLRDPNERAVMLRAALELLRSDTGDFARGLAFRNLAVTAHVSFGDTDTALALLDDAIALERRSGRRNRLAWWQLTHIQVRLDVGATAGTEEQLAEAEAGGATARTGFLTFVLTLAAFIRGRWYLATGDPNRAMQELGVVIRGELGYSDPFRYRDVASCWYALAAQRVGDEAGAEAAARAALAAAPPPSAPSAYEDWPSMTVAAIVLADLEVEHGDLEAAATVLASTLEAVRTVQLLPSALHLCVGAARLSAALGDAPTERALLALAAHHPAACAYTREEAGRWSPPVAAGASSQGGRPLVRGGAEQGAEASTDLATVLARLEAAIAPRRRSRSA